MEAVRKVLPLREHEAEHLVPPGVGDECAGVFGLEPAAGDRVISKLRVLREHVFAHAAGGVQARSTLGDVRVVVPVAHDDVLRHLCKSLGVEGEEVVPHPHALAVLRQEIVSKKNAFREQFVAALLFAAARTGAGVPRLVKAGMEVRPGKYLAEIGDVAREEVARRRVGQAEGVAAVAEPDALPADLKVFVVSGIAEELLRMLKEGRPK